MVAPPDPFEDAWFHLPVGVVKFTPEGRIVRANPAFCRMIGCAEAWLAGRSLADLAEGPFTEALARLLRRVESDPTGTFRVDQVLRHADGTLVHAQGSVSFARDAEGRVCHALAFVVDVTEQERVRVALVDAEARTAKSVALLEQAFELAPVGMIVCDADFRIRRANPAIAAILARPRDALIGCTYLEFLHPDEHAASLERMRAVRVGALSSGESERRYLDGNGAERWIRATGTRITGLDGQPAYFGLFVDLTDQRTAEAERHRLQEQVVHAERLRTLGQIAGGLAHEVNNPAAIVVGGADLARRRVAAAIACARTGDLTATRRHLEQVEAALRYCEEGTHRIAEVARKIGAYSSLHGDEVAVVDMNELVRRALEVVQNDLRHRAHLRVELGELPPLAGHPVRLTQAITHLLVNAGQAIDGAPADHEISVHTFSLGGSSSEDSSSGSGTIIVTVSDTGEGIPEEQIERVFEAFYSTRPREQGSGLGLTVVRDVAREHRGRVEVVTAPGMGSRFSLHLPVDNGLAPLRAEPPGSRRARILLIDDEPFLLALLVEMLAEQHDTVVAEGGGAALELLRDDRDFDLVVCDLMMPDVDGIAVHAWLLEHAPTLAQRVVICTGGAFTSRAEAFLTQTRVTVLAKPFAANQVLRTLGHALASVE